MQLRLSRDEQLTNEFNLLLDVLVNMINNKKYEEIYKNPVDYKLFKTLIYTDICVRAKKDTMTQRELDYIYLLILSRNTFKGMDISDFKKESDIYSVLLARVVLATDSLAEAFIAILTSKLNEDILFFLNTEQMSDNGAYKSKRLFRSRVPFIIPKDLELELLQYFER
ncbi:hypothetical protein LZ667_21755 [Hafnia alvei]|uniref:hypothetical protein n=1 Tax=Hafnia alvei TaxID=569 RepID=UPI001F1700D0|nr:hypothetical protein [Hafnia alvei]MCE9873989.1 hypothetical protein [Hafnia alvei]